MESKEKNFDPQELFAAITLLEKEKNVSAEYLLTQITKAIETAAKKNYGYGSDRLKFKIDIENRQFDVYVQKEVMAESFNNNLDLNLDISLEKAREINPAANVGDYVYVKLDTKSLGRIGINAARNIIKQGINEGEKGQLLLELKNKIGELVSATVENVNTNNGSIGVKIGKTIAYLNANEQVKGETFHEGDVIKVYISDVQKKEKGNSPKVLISRTHPEFVKRMFETEVPEIYDGTVEIKSVSREAGSRTKIAVYSKDKHVDAVGSCIGTKGTRVGTIVDELNGEKIDIIEYDEDPKKFISAALAPASVVKVQTANDGSKVCRVTVPDSQLSLAIGNKGQNVRLAAKLTGWKIDIRPESGFFGEEEDSKFIEDILPKKQETDAYLDKTMEETPETAEETPETTEETSEIFAEEEITETEEE